MNRSQVFNLISINHIGSFASLTQNIDAFTPGLITIFEHLHMQRSHLLVFCNTAWIRSVIDEHLRYFAAEGALLILQVHLASLRVDVES